MTYLDQIAQLDAARTQGEWKALYDANEKGAFNGAYLVEIGKDSDGSSILGSCGCCGGAGGDNAKDMDFIAAMSRFAPWAVRMLREAGRYLRGCGLEIEVCDLPPEERAWLAALEKGPDPVQQHSGG